MNNFGILFLSFKQSAQNFWIVFTKMQLLVKQCLILRKYTERKAFAQINTWKQWQFWKLQQTLDSLNNQVKKCSSYAFVNAGVFNNIFPFFPKF